MCGVCVCVCVCGCVCGCVCVCVCVERERDILNNLNLLLVFAALLECVVKALVGARVQLRVVLHPQTCSTWVDRMCQKRPTTGANETYYMRTFESSHFYTPLPDR
jgi:hypothetical protein